MRALQIFHNRFTTPAAAHDQSDAWQLINAVTAAAHHSVLEQTVCEAGSRQKALVIIRREMAGSAVDAGKLHGRPCLYQPRF